MKTEETKLEQEIIVAGIKLLSPPASARELLHLLEKLENCLRRVEQSPPESVHRAMNPALKALMAKKLFNHPDLDVKVTLASCFSEILRIRAPIFPYDDDKMKEILQLIVAAFEHLHDTTSPSYHRRVLILEIVGKVRPWILMVDLQCYSLIVEMFKHFLTNIRESHPDVVFSSMGIIMILILREIEEIPLEIISLLLGTTGKENQDVLPVARKLGERVIENCRSKLKPYIPQAIQCCGKKRRRSELQNSAIATEKTNGGSGIKEQVFQEEDNTAGIRKAKMKVLKEKKHKKEDDVSLWEIMKVMRSRESQKDQAICKEEDNRKENRKAKMQVFREEKHQKEGEVPLSEIVREKRSRGGVQKDQIFQEEDSTKDSKKSKMKVFKEKKHRKDDEVLLRDIVKEKRSRGVQKDQAVGIPNKFPHFCLIFQENNEKESRKAKMKVLKEKKHQKEDVVFLGENLRDKNSKQVVQKGQPSERRLKYKGKQAMDTQCNQQKMHEFLSNLKGTKRSIIENSIFSAFLDIPRRPVHRQLVAALIERFDAKMDAIIIAGQPLKFCSKEIEECIGLSFEGKTVDKNFQRGNKVVHPLAWRYFEIVEGNARIKNESKAVDEDMGDGGKTRNYLRVPKGLLLQKLNVMSVDGKSEAEDFLRLSILYMFNVYFFPNGGNYISWWPLKFLENLEDFNSYAWGCVVYDYLHACLVKAARKLAGKNEVHTYMGGCIPLLEILVCERISKLQVPENQTNLHPLVLNYNKRSDVKSFYSFRNLLAKLQPNEIKKCEHCENDL